MTSRELNLKLTEALPEIKNVYNDETSWQEGDETGSHMVYADVLVPYIKEQIATKNRLLLIKIFDFIELLITTNDEYANEVVELSVLESLLFDEETDKNFFLQFAKQNTLKMVESIIQNL